MTALEEEVVPVGELTEFVESIVAPWREMAAFLEQDRDRGNGRLAIEGERYLLAYLAAGIAMVFESDPNYPQFVRFADPVCSWGINNPDGNYAFLAVDGGASYRIIGDLGNAPVIEFQVNAPTFTGAPRYRNTATRKRGDLTVGPDGSFELFVGGPERSGNWLPLTPDAESVVFRQFFEDWGSARPARLAVERLDRQYPPPPYSASDLDDRVRRLAAWHSSAGVYWIEMCRMGFEVENSLVFHPPSFSDWGGHQGQSYGFGNFLLGPDEALVIDLEIPPCDYWMVQLSNRLWDSLDFDRRQTSLNGAQARLDGDGHFRGVVSIDDPGVANWLDPGGNSWGALMGRIIGAAEVPSVTCTVVRRKDLDEFLPADTERVTRDVRDAVLRRRHLDSQLRQGY